MSIDAAVVIAGLALLVSIITLWLTHLRVGRIMLTQPSQIYLGPDGGQGFAPKIFIRTLLYSTSARGRCLENMFVRLKRGEASQNFSIWVHGHRNDLIRASGILVGPNGTDHAHHFLMSPDADFKFQLGTYQCEIHMKSAGDMKARLAFSCRLDVSEKEAELINSPYKGLYFDWGPDSQSYQKHIRATAENIVIPGLQDHASNEVENQ